MNLTDDVHGGGFAEVRDGQTITPVIRPPRESLPDEATDATPSGKAD